MNCKRVCSRLSAYQDGELSQSLASELQRHVENCAACRLEWQDYQDLLGSLRRLSAPVPAPNFSSRIMAGLPMRPENKHRLLPSLAYVLACFTLFVSVFLLEISTNGQPATAKQPATSFSAVLTESRNLGLLAVQDSTLEFLSNLKQIDLVKKQDNLLSKLLILRSRVDGDDYER